MSQRKRVKKEREAASEARADITSIPTLMAFRDGVLVSSKAGALPAASLEQLITAVKDLNMDDVRASIAEQQANAGREPADQ